MTRKYEGQVEAVLVSTVPGEIESRRRSQVRVTLEGFEGDRHAGPTMAAGVRQGQYPRGVEVRNTRQVSIVSTEELDQIAASLGVPHVLPEWLGANLLVSGIPNLTKLPAGTRIYFAQEAALVVDEENLPCRGPGEIIQSNYPESRGIERTFTKTAIGLRGLVGWVEGAGMIAAGDSILVEVPQRSNQSGTE